MKLDTKANKKLQELQEGFHSRQHFLVPLNGPYLLGLTPHPLLKKGTHLPYFRANILWLTDTFAYLFGFPGEYYKVTIIIYWIEVLPFVRL